MNDHIKKKNTEPYDRLLENMSVSAQQKHIIDTAKRGLTYQQLDESTLPPESVRDERIKKKARTIKWWEDREGGSSSIQQVNTESNSELESYMDIDCPPNSTTPKAKASIREITSEDDLIGFNATNIEQVKKN